MNEEELLQALEVGVGEALDETADLSNAVHSMEGEVAKIVEDSIPVEIAVGEILDRLSAIEQSVAEIEIAAADALENSKISLTYNINSSEEVAKEVAIGELLDTVNEIKKELH